jgi:competence protein ComEC
MSLQGCLIISVLWFYAFLTGLSPSVWRAATMFSLLSIGQILRRITGIYQTIAASAFLLLLIDTQLLFSPGFQLSYTAVIGIVRYQPQMEIWWIPRKKWMVRIWQLVTVSLAAQLVTFPISLYYFGQFPTYFLPANLLIIPLLSTLMISSVLILLPALIMDMPRWLTLVLDHFYALENGIVHFITDLPEAVITPLYISLPGVLVLGVACILLLESVRYRNAKLFIGSLAAWSILVMTYIPVFSGDWNNLQYEDVYGKAERLRYKYHSLVIKREDVEVHPLPFTEDEVILHIPANTNWTLPGNYR